MSSRTVSALFADLAFLCVSFARVFKRMLKDEVVGLELNVSLGDASDMES